MLRFLALALILITLGSKGQPLVNNFLCGRTTGPLANMEYGPGDDRLGGAKATYLDSNILVRVTDSTKDDYIIRLSKNHLAYLPRTAFKPDTTVVLKPDYLSTNWRVYGDDKYDYVAISLDERLPYKSVQQIDPARIVVDLYGVTSNTNWITQLSTVKEIRNSWYEQPEDDVFRVIIDLKHKQHWGYSIYYEGKKLIIRVKRQPADLSLSKVHIAIDAGHGGDNTGADGVKTKILEKKYTLLIARELQKTLEKEHATVFMTRTKDTTLSMPERWAMLKADDPDFLISIHLNSSSYDTIQGVSTYYRYIGFRPLTQFILDRMVQLGLKEHGNVGSFNFSLSGPTDFPNCLVEVAFLSNKFDEQLILDPEFHKAVACQITEGIKDWLKSLEQ